MKRNNQSLTTKFSALALVLAMMLSLLAGCGQTTQPAASSTPPAASSEPAASEPETPEIPETMEGDEFGNGAIGTHGGVSSGSVYASQAGLEILQAGGNAVDAAVATAFAVGVCEPNLSGIGGCGMMNIYLADNHEYEILEYMETVPVAVEPGWYNPETDSATAKNAAVPGQVAGLLTALEKYGTMTPEEVMAPAIKLAREGFPIEDLKRICASMAECAQEAGVHLVTGDTKVVNRGHGDGVYINTSGVGTIPEGVNLGGAQCKPGDKVLVTGTLGDHGITIMSCRESLSFSADLESDAAPLNHLIAEVLAAAPNTRCFRDPTRGGLASTLNELAAQSNTDITVEEDAIPVKPAVQGACEMLGYDVLQVANEGKMVCVVAAEEADAALAAMRANRYGADAAIIGEVSAARPERGSKVFLRTAFGGTRILDMLVGEQLPRIC